jgi:hypothetical protein
MVSADGGRPARDKNHAHRGRVCARTGLPPRAPLRVSGKLGAHPATFPSDPLSGLVLVCDAARAIGGEEGLAWVLARLQNKTGVTQIENGVVPSSSTTHS